MINPNRNKNSEILVYSICLILLFCASMYLFYNQIMQTGVHFPSDTRFYTNIAMKGDGDRCLTIILGLVYKLTGSVYSLAAYLGLVIVFTCIAANKLLQVILSYLDTDVNPNVTRAISLITVFSGNIYIPIFHEYFYRKSWNSYAWQSPTQQSVIMLSLVTLTFFLLMFRDYKDSISVKYWLAAAVFGFFATWTKPSFFMIFAPSIVVVFLIELIGLKGKILMERFRRLFIMGSALFPALGIMLYYMFWYQGAVGGSEIHFGLSNFIYETPTIGLLIRRVVSGLTIPIIVLIFNTDKLKNFPYKLVCTMFIVGVLEWMLIYESGRNAHFGNFGWGKQLACLLMFLISYAIIISDFKAPNFLANHLQIRKLYYLMIACTMFLMLTSQVFFFLHLLLGGKYLC